MQNELLIRELYCIKNSFGLNQNWNRKEMIVGPKVGQENDQVVFCERYKEF
jgi:hypothetical protein